MEQIVGFLNLNIFFFHLKKWNKRIIVPLLLLFVSITLFSQKYSISVPFEKSNFKFEKTDSFTSIQCIENKDIRYPMPVGEPGLPYISFYVLMPHNSNITGISIEKGNFQTVEGDYRIELKTNEENISDSGYSAFPVGNYYPSDDQIALFDSSQLYAGFLMNRIFLCPFRYIEKNQRLLFSNRIVIEITYTTEDKPLKFETSPEKIGLSREFIREMVINPEEIIKTIPLEEKIDYSKIQIFRDFGKDSGKTKTVEPLPVKSKEGKPFYIKQIKTK